MATLNIINSGRYAATHTAPTFVGAGAKDQSIGGLTLTPHASTAVGDLMLMIVESDSGDNTPTPTGWNAVGAVSDLSASRIEVFSRVFQTGDTSFAVSDSGDHAVGAILSFHGSAGVDQSNFSSNIASSTSFSITGVTTTQDHEMVVAIIGNGDAGDGSFAGWTNANLASITEACDYGTGSGNNGAFAAAYGVKVAAGATGNTTGTMNSFPCSKATVSLFGV